MRKILTVLLKVLCYLTLIIGVYFTYILFFGKFDVVSGTIGMVPAQNAGYFSFLFLSATLILLKLKNRKQNPKTYYTILVIGLVLTISFLLPLTLTPWSISHGDSEFREAFGGDWKGEIPSDVEDRFTQTPFNLSRYYLGEPNEECTIKENIKYYDNEGIKLNFDVYLPPEDGKGLLGNRSTIIKIHGGGWVAGDKGVGNMIPNSKYLASQGYVVFDIQYGLRDTDASLVGGFLEGITPEYKLGDFTVDDQIRHIGIFSKKLENTYAKEYRANLDSVYVMGGSAGGHLSSVFGLGYGEDYFENTFADNLNIKGVIPLYPAVDAEHHFHNQHPNLLPGPPETNPKLYKYYDPSKIVDENDPPVVVFQGTSDGLVPPEQSEMLEEALKNHDVKCCRLLFPLAGHANDFMYNSNYSQVWTYYLERFLYLTRQPNTTKLQ